MTQSEKKRRRKPRGSGIKTGMAPGTMVFIGERKQEKARIDVIEYDDTKLNELRDVSADRCMEFAKSSGVTWINVNGIHDIALVEILGKGFNLHPLTLEDIVSTAQRLKIEEFPSYVFIVLKMMSFNQAANSVEIEQVSLIVGENYVISFQEQEGDVFNTVRDRMRTAKGRIRAMKSDYLAYSLMDAIVDQYFVAVERIGDRIEDIDDRILAEPKPKDINEIHGLKRDILSLRKAVWPLREEIGRLEKSESSIIGPETKVFWRDLYDHTIQIIDMVETYRDILGGLQDTYLSSISNRMNEVMKVLTIIATIFIPLTFIVGVYGMNFEHMPELKWPFGYYLVWTVMLVIGIGLLAYFKRKKWI
ncbi:MAG: magnesium and cobalt transport protein CorA [Deltaproteobacteria bacterium HGW-Deltaproteobacteria-15]|nr:MAG: magnesium and cobalt transport protein CorA [Deltaproteobacteria bacterium HGW-Deltaproteobacteria-15]